MPARAENTISLRVLVVSERNSWSAVMCSTRWRLGLCGINPPLCTLQLKKLGVMPPEQPLPVKCNRIYQIMWANNGDAISRQYAGTAALKVGKCLPRASGRHSGGAGGPEGGFKPSLRLR